MYRDGEAPPHPCTRRTLIRTSLGLGAGATLTTVGLPLLWSGLAR